MHSRRLRLFCLTLVVAASQARAQSSTSTANSRVSQKQLDPSTSLRADVGHPGSQIDAGTVSNGVYRNKTLGLSCKIPAGWVLRTDEMNEPEENQNRQTNVGAKTGEEAQPQRTRRDTKDNISSVESAGGRVLLAAFSRPPEARGEEVNASIVIAAESAATYPGLKEAVQYFGPLTEVAKAQGFTVDEEPYEIAMGTKTLMRGDFHKDVGTRVMRQSTLAMLSHGYAVSITVIAGTEEEVEDLMDALDFGATGR